MGRKERKMELILSNRKGRLDQREYHSSEYRIAGGSQRTSSPGFGECVGQAEKGGYQNLTLLRLVSNSMLEGRASYM